jgi:hypothetical protein
MEPGVIGGTTIEKYISIRVTLGALQVEKACKKKTPSTVEIM